MKFILSNWSGFEVDSSEFYASIETTDVPRTIAAFTESPFIDEDFRFKGFSAFIDSLEQAKSENKIKFSKITMDNKTLDDYLQDYIKRIEEDEKSDFESIKEGNRWSYFTIRLNLIDKLDIAYIAKNLLKEFPKLSSVLSNCYYTFYRKDKHPDEAASTYIITLTGIPHKYSMNWNDTSGWTSILESIRRKAPLKWKQYDP